jgi:hypothetical protein
VGWRCVEVAMRGVAFSGDLRLVTQLFSGDLATW